MKQLCNARISSTGALISPHCCEHLTLQSEARGQGQTKKQTVDDTLIDITAARIWLDTRLRKAV